MFSKVELFQKMCILIKKKRVNMVKISNRKNTNTNILLYKYINYNLFSIYTENEQDIFVSSYLNAYLPSDLKNKCLSTFNNYYDKKYDVCDIAEILPDGNILVYCKTLDINNHYFASSITCKPKEMYYYNIKNNLIIPLSNYKTRIINTKSNMLIAIGGGFIWENYSYVCTSEISDSIKFFSIQENTWKTLNSKLITARCDAELIEMLDGQILIIGGRNNPINYFCNLVKCELYNPKTDTIKQVCSLNIARSYHNACLLPNGFVLVSGGLAIRKDNNILDKTDSCEIYNPLADSWTIVNPMNTSRVCHHSWLLNNKQVVIFDPNTKHVTKNCSENREKNFEMYSF